MATSGAITFNMTARDAITQAFRRIGEYGRDETPSAEDAQFARVELNLMLKTWQADGCHLWREYEDSASFAADTAEVTLDPRVLDVMEARRVDGDNELPLGRWERQDYLNIPTKTTSGTPTIFTLLKERDAIKMRVWPVPTATTTINYTAARVIEDVVSLNDNLDVPQEWLETVVACLADRLIDPFDVALARPTVAQRVQQRAQQLFSALRDFDRPASIFFQSA